MIPTAIEQGDQVEPNVHHPRDDEFLRLLHIVDHPGDDLPHFPVVIVAERQLLDMVKQPVADIKQDPAGRPLGEILTVVLYRPPQHRKNKQCTPENPQKMVQFFFHRCICQSKCHRPRISELEATTEECRISARPPPWLPQSAYGKGEQIECISEHSPMKTQLPLSDRFISL